MKVQQTNDKYKFYSDYFTSTIPTHCFVRSKTNIKAGFKELLVIQN